MSPWWLMIPILSALIGWLTVQWGVKLFLGRVLPRQRAQWTAQLAKAVSAEFFNQPLRQPFDELRVTAIQDDNSGSFLEQKVANPESFEKLRPQLEVHIDDFMRQGLPKAFPIISTFIGERTIGQLKEIFMKELETIFPQVMKGYVKNLQQDLNLEQMVVDKVNAIPTEKMQAAAYRAIGGHVNKAALLAGLFGLLVGIIELFIVLFTTGIL
ncbi:MAG: DUF445 domain-containing protein [Niastella sp.]|nr:DUF445 domain-containing protein [Niastella sp.]